MTPKELNPRFTLSETTEAEMEEVMIVTQLAMANDAVWGTAFAGCGDEDIHKFVMDILVPRWNMPDITTYKIVEKDTGYITTLYSNIETRIGLTELDIGRLLRGQRCNFLGNRDRAL
jgi:hypothetical protein